MFNENYDKDAVESTVIGFVNALIWQDESLDGFGWDNLDYYAKEKCQDTCNLFCYIASLSDDCNEELHDSFPHQIGHSFALQMLGHGSGFFDSKSTKNLDVLLDDLLSKKVIKPFHLYFNEDTKQLSWDSC